METGRRLGVGVVGYGYAGRAFHSYLVSLEAAHGLDLRAIATRDPGRQAQARRNHPEVRVQATLDDMLRDDGVELVVIATPHDTHRDLALRALAAGRHVVVDKVMCLNAAEADAMIEAAERAGRLLTVFHNRRWDWDYLTVREVLARGLLGAPYLFESSVFTYGEPRGWRGARAQGGGVLYDWGAHLVDQALQLVPGPVQRVECVLQSRHWQHTDAGSYARLTLHFESGVLFVVEVGNLARRGKPRWYILGDEGALLRQSRDPQEPFLNRQAIDRVTEAREERALVTTARGGLPVEAAIETVHGSWRSFYQNVADASLRGVPLAVEPREVRRALAVFDAAEAAARTGMPVRPQGE